jgi:8-hydroxy-5-deazaflavin:NADPH oxidoreductase
VEQFGKELPDWTGKTIVDATNAHYAPNAAKDILKGRLPSHYVAEVPPGAGATGVPGQWISRFRRTGPGA